MKLVRLVPAVTATLVLAACSTATNTMKDASTTVPEATAKVVDTATGAMVQTTEVLETRNQSVVYNCNTGRVTATYAFHGGEIKGANIRLGKKMNIDGFVLDQELSQKVDSPVFVSGDYVLSVDKGLSFNTATKTDLVMVYKKGQLADKILAKNCSINSALTKRLNK